MKTTILRRRGLRVLALGVLAAAGAACTDFLVAENPGAVEEVDLNQPAYIGLLTNGVVGDFQLVASWINYYGALYTDELYNTHVFFEERLFDTRDVTEANGTYSFFLYSRLHRARYQADNIAARLRIILADSAGRDTRLAMVYAYAGYNYIYLGEHLCESPIDVSAPLPPSELFTRAIARFDSAILVANAAKAHPGASAGTIQRADSIINFASVGAARAALNMNDLTVAIDYAEDVPAAFRWDMHFSENSSTEFNMWYGRLSTLNSGSNSATISFTPFEAMDGDPRIPRPDTTEAAMNGLSIFIPNSPLAFSTYSGTDDGADFDESSDIRLASGLEAQYIVAEASGATPETRAFVDARRAVGNLLPMPVGATDAEVMAELREQRRRDLYLDGHRMGDLRRYLEFYGIDDWPTGPYPNTTIGDVYLPNYCWPLTIAELNGNPNIP